MQHANSNMTSKHAPEVSVPQTPAESRRCRGAHRRVSQSPSLEKSSAPLKEKPGRKTEPPAGLDVFNKEKRWKTSTSSLEKKN